MSAQVYVNTRTATFPGGEALAGVTVSLHQLDGTLLTTDVTDANGNVYLGDRAATTYEIRITAPNPSKITAGNRQQVVVIDSVDPLVFDVLVDVSALSPATDSRYCRCSGVFADAYGRAEAGVVIRFQESCLPNLLYDSVVGRSSGVLPAGATIVTDEDGFASVDLIRGATYLVTVAQYENTSWEVLVPTASAASLPDVIFPTIQRAEYRVGGALVLPVSSPSQSISAGGTSELAVTIVMLSGLELDNWTDLVTFTSSDETVVAVSMASDGESLLLTGVAAGVATVAVAVTEPDEDGYGVDSYPVQAIVGSISVTVTP